jgi:hypothetical protein
MTFEPARRRRSQERRERHPIELGLIYRAVIVTIAAGLVVGASWGVLGRILAGRLSKATFDGLMQATWLHVIGFLVGLIPIAVGAIYLADRLERGELRHGVIIGVIDLAASLFFKAGFTRDPTSVWEVVYYLCVIPTAAAIGWW